MPRSPKNAPKPPKRPAQSASIVKHLKFDEKANFTQRSFEAKLELAAAMITSWRKTGSRPIDKSWFETKIGFAEKHDPEAGIDWGSPNIMSGKLEAYRDLFARWETLCKQAADFQSDKEITKEVGTRLEAELAKSSKLQFNLAEVMDALKRVSPNDEVFKRIDLVW